MGMCYVVMVEYIVNNGIDLCWCFIGMVNWIVKWWLEFIFCVVLVFFI